jgi:hypothetical protein
MGGFIKHRIGLDGSRFGRLIVVELADTKHGHARWVCSCDCGNVVVVYGLKLRRGLTRSCGCLRSETSGRRGRVQLFRHGHAGTPIYQIWLGIKHRCLNSNDRAFANYGGWGIAICDRWCDSFEAFLADVGPRPSPAHSIDRKDNNGNYEPGNVRWATTEEQARNKRTNVWIEFDGSRRLVVDWAERLGISASTLHSRLKRPGWTVRDVITTPLGGRPA